MVFHRNCHSRLRMNTLSIDRNSRLFAHRRSRLFRWWYAWFYRNLHDSSAHISASQSVPRCVRGRNKTNLIYLNSRRWIFRDRCRAASRTVSNRLRRKPRYTSHNREEISEQLYRGCFSYRRSNLKNYLFLITSKSCFLQNSEVTNQPYLIWSRAAPAVSQANIIIYYMVCSILGAGFANSSSVMLPPR